MDKEQELVYPTSERELKKSIDCLMSEWENNSLFPDNCFSSDGFYPYYTTQQYRILFVGRESRGLGGRDYIKVLHDAYKGLDGCGQRIGGRPMNCLAFHRRIFKVTYGLITYGLINEIPIFKSVPKASILAKDFATEQGISFAFMELSKFSNPSDEDSSSNWYNINQSIKSSTKNGHNYIRDEVELLSPDIIIGSGVYDLHEIIQCHDVEKLSNDAFLLNGIARKKILYFTTYHFSGRNLRDCWYYDHIGNLFKLFRDRL